MVVLIFAVLYDWRAATMVKEAVKLIARISIRGRMNTTSNTEQKAHWDMQDVTQLN